MDTFLKSSIHSQGVFLSVYHVASLHSNMLKAISKAVKRPQMDPDVFGRIKSLGILKSFRGGSQHKCQQQWHIRLNMII